MNSLFTKSKPVRVCDGEHVRDVRIVDGHRKVVHDVVEVLLVDGDDGADDDDCNGSHHDEDANDDDEYDVGAVQRS